VTNSEPSLPRGGEVLPKGALLATFFTQNGRCHNAEGNLRYIVTHSIVIVAIFFVDSFKVA